MSDISLEFAPIQMRILLILRAAGTPLRQKELMRRLERDQRFSSAYLDPLERRGLIQRERVTRARTLVALTPLAEYAFAHVHEYL